METAYSIEISLRAKPFRTEGTKTHHFCIDPNGSVRVWDPIAKCYTSRHNLSTAAVKRIRRIATNY